jgi:hypothetical protein
MKIAITAFALLALTGCAYLQGQTAADSEEILAQAGFQRQPLDEPGLPARHLVEDRGTYKFADPNFCQCVYVGGATEFAELQRLRAERIAERNFALQHAYFGNANSPIVWGPWDPEGLNVTSLGAAPHAQAGGSSQGSAKAN